MSDKNMTEEQAKELTKAISAVAEELVDVHSSTKVLSERLSVMNTLLSQIAKSLGSISKANEY